MFNQRKSRRTHLFSRSNISRRTGPWEPEEDERLLAIVSELGLKYWKLIGIRHGLRDGKQCRERWHNHLNPELIYGPLTPEEDEQILTFYSEMGTKWSVMSQLLRRPANLIKNRYYSSLSKKRDRRTSENSSCCSPRSKKRIKRDNKVSEQSQTLNNQDYHRNDIDLPRTPDWSLYSNDSAYFELSMTQEPVSLLTPLTPFYTPITSPRPSALEQFADLAIENASQEFHDDTRKDGIMSISAVLN